MKKKDDRTLQERAEDLEKAYTFSIMATIKKYYSSLEEYKREYTAITSGKANFKTQVEFCRRFGHT